MKKIFSNLFDFKKKELDILKSDLELVEKLIERLSAIRYNKKYVDTINRLTVLKDNLRWKINQIKGGDNENER